MKIVDSTVRPTEVYWHRGNRYFTIILGLPRRPTVKGCLFPDKIFFMTMGRGNGI